MGFNVSLDLSEYGTAKSMFRERLQRLQRSGVEAAAKHGADHAKSVGRFKDNTGHLRGSIHATAPVNTSDGAWATIEAPAFYASYVESGTQAHWIRPIDYQNPSGARHTIGKKAGKFVNNPTFGAGRGKFLRFYRGGQVVFAREVWHPGGKPYPFMGPAYLAAESFLTTYLENGFIGLQAVWD